jgi:hypothetical protein
LSQPAAVQVKRRRRAKRKKRKKKMGRERKGALCY